MSPAELSRKLALIQDMRKSGRHALADAAEQFLLELVELDRLARELDEECA